jgi:hypothetical protein
MKARMRGRAVRMTARMSEDEGESSVSEEDGDGSEEESEGEGKD